MGLILGQYDAKPKGFAPGGMSLHNAMRRMDRTRRPLIAPRAPSSKPERLADTLAFMFEIAAAAASHRLRRRRSRRCRKTMPIAGRAFANASTARREDSEHETRLVEAGPRRPARRRVARSDARGGCGRHRADAAGGARRLGATPRRDSRRSPQQLEAGPVATFRFASEDCASPLPRAYQWADGSAYVNHVALVRKARGAEMPPSFWTDPLMYQGGSDSFLGPRDTIPLAGRELWARSRSGGRRRHRRRADGRRRRRTARAAHQARHAGQ